MDIGQIWENHWQKLLPLLLLVLLGAGFLISALLLQNDAPAPSPRVYYFNATTGLPEGVTIPIPEGARIMQIHDRITRFYTPRNGLAGLWPEGLGLLGVAYYDDMVGIAFPLEFWEIPPLEEALFRVGLVLTLLELPEVERVAIWVDGVFEKPPVPFEDWFPLWASEEHDWEWESVSLQQESIETLSFRPQISPGMMAARTITLYFVCAYGEGLVTETFVDDYVDLLRLAEYKLQLLINGPDRDDAMHLIPPETRVRDVDLEAGNMYVDLSGDFMSRFSGNRELASLMLQSIVNTLTLPGNNREHVWNVFFLIDSSRYDVFHGVLGFDAAFTYDHDIILYEEQPYPTGEYNGGANDDAAAYSDDGYTV